MIPIRVFDDLVETKLDVYGDISAEFTHTFVHVSGIIMITKALFFVFCFYSQNRPDKYTQSLRENEGISVLEFFSGLLFCGRRFSQSFPTKIKLAIRKKIQWEI